MFNLRNVKNIQKLNEQVLQQGLEDDHSWHRQYKDSAYIFIGKKSSFLAMNYF